MKLYLLRHAQSVSNYLNLNVSSSIESTPEESLSSKGQLQALSLVQPLVNLGLDEIWCSDFKRAKQTIQPFLAQAQIPIHYDWRLREGVLILDSLEPAVELNGLLASAGNTDERPEQFVARVNSVKRRIVEFSTKQPNHSMLLVSHGHFIRELLNSLLATSVKIRFPHENAGLTCVTLTDSIYVDYINRSLIAPLSN